MIFATFTFSEEEYSKLAKEVRGDIIKQYGEVQGDIDNEIAAKAIRYWNGIFADERDDGQNFWLNKLQEADFRRVMAAKQIPNL